MITLPALSQPHCAIALMRFNEQFKPNLTRLSSSLIARADQFNGQRRMQYLAGRSLLAELLFHQTGINQLPDIQFTCNGRPHFCDSTLPDFNISHSGGYIMAAIASRGCIGLDIEHIRPRKHLLAVAQHRFSDLEYQWLKSLDNDTFTNAFWRLWTLRESILKYASKGVWQMKALAIAPEQQLIYADFLPALTSITVKQDALFWALSTNLPLTAQAINFWQAVVPEESAASTNLTFLPASLSNVEIFHCHR